jgi:hypothetical protein
MLSVQLPTIRSDSGAVAFDMNNFLIHPRKGGGKARA